MVRYTSDERHKIRGKMLERASGITLFMASRYVH